MLLSTVCPSYCLVCAYNLPPPLALIPFFTAHCRVLRLQMLRKQAKRAIDMLK